MKNISESVQMRQRVAEETKRKRVGKTILKPDEYTESIMQTAREPILVLDSDRRVISANRAFTETPESQFTSPILIALSGGLKQARRLGLKGFNNYLAVLR